MFRINSIALTIILALYFVFGLNFTLATKIYHILMEESGLGFGFYLSIPVFFISAMTFIFALFVSKYLTKPLFITILIAGACVNYGAYQFGIVFNQEMMVNIFETTPAEATSYLNLKLIIWIGLSGFLPALLLTVTHIEYKPFFREFFSKLAMMIICLGIIGGIAALYYKDYASIARNNPKMQKDIVPTYFIGSTVKYIKNTYFKKTLPYQEIGTDAKRITNEEHERYLFVYLVGETARSQNYQLNGYERETNAYTSKIDNVVSFKNATSCGTATAVSLPCMFSMMSKDDYSRDKFDSQDNLVDILRRTGYHQVWLDNNTGCKGICKHIENHAITDMTELNCHKEECTDAVFLDILDKTIQSFNGEDGVIYLHLIGSHGPTYYQRYPRDHAKFLPDCQTSDLQNCSAEEIRNSYDNSILFTDYVMANIINKLKTYNKNYKTGVVYMSDHGESLGENGLYLHGMPYALAPDEQTHVPLMVWFSDEMIHHEELDMTCLRNKAQNGSFSHDNISHTLLDLLDIETDAYDPSKDIFEQCEND